MIYLDNNATTQPDPRVVRAVRQAQEQWWANPSSVHRFGQQVRGQMELARAALAELLNGKPREIIFTSGATESNNLALRGIAAVRANRRTLLTTAIEHAAIIEPCDQLASQGYTILHAPLLPGGAVDPDAFADLVEEHADDLALASIHWANNETGVIQPIEALARCCADQRIPFHTDATQAVGKIPVDLSAVPVSALSLSGHKFHGPRGIGALVVRGTTRLIPQQHGGPQERERRGGTENTPGILGLGVAAQLARDFLQSNQSQRLAALRDRLENELLRHIDGAVVNGVEAPRLWNTTNLAFPRLQAEAVLLLLSEKGLCASAGAACSSGSLEPSPVLRAMGVPEPLAHGSVRFSLSRNTTEEEIGRALEIIPAAVEKLRSALPH